MNKYAELKEANSKKTNAWGGGKMFFAFSDEQFYEGLKKVGFVKGEHKLVDIGGGGFVRKDFIDEFREVFGAFSKVIQKHLDDYDFMVDAFDYELGEHEYFITRDVEDTIEALGLCESDFKERPMLLEALKEGIKRQLEWYKQNG